MGKHIRPSEEILAEQIFDAARWALEAAGQAPKPVYQVTASIPLIDPATVDETDNTGEVWGVIRLHGVVQPRGVVFESPWLTCELDPEKLAKDDEWWKELGL